MHRPGKGKRSLANSRGGKMIQASSGQVSVQQALQQAIQHHRAGQLQQAEGLYRQVIAVEPGNADACHLLGLLAKQFGKNDAAIALIQQAIRKKPDFAEAYSNLGLVLQGMGRLGEAMVNYRTAISLKPDYVEAHNNLGNALQEQGQLVEAIASYRTAISLKPDYAEAYNNLGNVLKGNGQLNEAMACYRQALVLKPDYAEAHSNLGTLFQDQGQLAEAMNCYRQALVFKPDYAEGHNNLGNVLQVQGLLPEAVASYGKAILLKPDYAEAHCNLGVALQEGGQLPEAMASYRKTLLLQPDHGEAHRYLSRIKKHRAYDDEIRKMEDLYTGGKVSGQQRMHLAFGLGKAFEDLKEYQKAFDYIMEGNRLKRATYTYSLSEVAGVFKRIQEVFSAIFFASHAGTGNPDDTPIFILGMPRSGTSLVEQILSSHPQVFGAGELHELNTICANHCAGRAGLDFPECVSVLGREVFSTMGSVYLESIRKRSGAAPHVTDKMPGNFIRIGLIKMILPEAKIIHCLRDPMDNCLSIFKNYFTGTHNYAYDQVELAQYYKLYLDLMEHWRTVLPGCMHELRYEELVSDQEGQTRKLLAYCGLSWDAACLSFHRTKRSVSTASAAQVRRPMYNNSVGMWKRYEEQLAPMRKVLLG